MKRVFWDFFIIVLSIVFAVLLAKYGVVQKILALFGGNGILLSFISGLFFTSAFTTAPSIVALTEIAKESSIYLVAIFGGMGALLGDIVIFKFIKDRVAEDIDFLIRKTKTRRFFTIFRLHIWKWLTPFIGGLIIASPLPDEIGLMMLGLSKVRISIFIAVSLVFNTLGIALISILSKSLL